MSRPTFSLCCVVDENPRFYVESILWALSTTRNLPRNFNPIIYFVGNVPADLLGWINNQGIRVRVSAPMVEGSPHSNKIAPFFDDHGADFTIVCDADLFWLSDPTELLTNGGRFRAAPNNHCNPPPRIFRSILTACGLNRPYRPGMALFKGREGLRETHINNISAGIVVAPRDRAQVLAKKWRKWATWLVQNRSLLEGWAIHIDQVGFALAMEELSEDVEFLSPHLNTILHLLGDISTCYALHLTTAHIPVFPQMFNADHTLVTDDLAEDVRANLGRLNQCIPEAVEAISALRSTRDHLEKFLNPAWLRQ